MKSLKTQGMIPVLFVLPCLGAGGSERVVLNLCRELRRDFLPVVAAFRGGELVESLRDCGVAVHVLNRRDGIDPALVFALRKLIRSYRIRVVNAHHFGALFYAFWACALTRVPLVHTEHSRWEIEGLPPWWKLCFRFFLGRLAQITAVSRGAFEYLTEHYPASGARTALIRNGIDIELFRQMAGQNLTRQQFGLAVDDLVVGSVGNLRREKNQALLIRALALFGERRHRIKLLLVGDGPCRTELEALAADLGVSDRVKFLGIRHDVPQLYGLMDIYCLVSRYEGLPLTLLEAMAAGKPIVATDVLGIREVVRNRHNGLLVADNDAEQLKNALAVLALRPDLRRRLAEQGRAQVSAEYGFDQCAAGYRSVFTRLGRWQSAAAES